MPSTIGSRIKLARQHLADTTGSAVTQAGLAKLCGWSESQSRVSNYESNGREPPRAAIEIIAEVTGVNPDWLMFGNGPMTGVPQIIDLTDENAAREAMEGWFSFMPKGQLTARLGKETVIESEQIIDDIAFSDAALSRHSLDKKMTAVIRVVGDAMAPTLISSDKCAVDLRPNQGFTDGLYALAFGNSIAFRRIKMRMDGGIDVLSDNPAYNTESFTAEQAAKSLTVIGRVVWHCRNLN